MKPVLRTLLAINAVIVLLFGLLFLLTPWLSVYPALSGFASSPALIGQLLGVFLLGFSALQAQAVFSGRLTAPVGRIAGTSLALAGVVVLIWDIALGLPDVDRSADYAVPFVGVVVLVLGLIQARLGGGVMAQERRLAVGEASARRAEVRAGSKANDAVLHSGADADPYIGTPSAAVSRDATGTRFAGGPGELAETEAATRAERERRHELPPSL